MLQTPRLGLRSFEEADIEVYGQLVFSDADVMRYMNATGTVPMNPVRHARAFIDERQFEWRQRGYSAWAITDREDGTFMGHVGLFHIEGTQIVEIGYTLGKVYWGQGYATEAARAVRDWGFTHIDKIQREGLVAVAFPQNAGSLRVMEKIGMVDGGLTSDYYGIELAIYRMSYERYQEVTDKES